QQVQDAVQPGVADVGQPGGTEFPDEFGGQHGGSPRGRTTLRPAANAGTRYAGSICQDVGAKTVEPNRPDVPCQPVMTILRGRDDLTAIGATPIYTAGKGVATEQTAPSGGRTVHPMSSQFDASDNYLPSDSGRNCRTTLPARHISLSAIC